MRLVALSIFTVALVITIAAGYFFLVHDSASGRCARGDFGACVVIAPRASTAPAEIVEPLPTDWLGVPCDQSRWSCGAVFNACSALDVGMLTPEVDTCWGILYGR